MFVVVVRRWSGNVFVGLAHPTAPAARLMHSSLTHSSLIPPCSKGGILTQPAHCRMQVFLVPWIWLGAVVLLAIAVGCLLLYVKAWARPRQMLLPVGGDKAMGGDNTMGRDSAMGGDNAMGGWGQQQSLSGPP